MGSHICTWRTRLSLVWVCFISCCYSLPCLVSTVKTLPLFFFCFPLLSVLNTTGLLGGTFHRAVMLNSFCIHKTTMRTLASYGISKNDFSAQFLALKQWKYLKCLFLKSCLPFEILVFGGVDVCALERKSIGKNQTGMSAFHFTENPGCVPSILLKVYSYLLPWTAMASVEFYEPFALSL